MSDEPTERSFRPALITLVGIAICCVLGAGFIALAHRLNAVHAGPWAVGASIVGYVVLIMTIAFGSVHAARRAAGVRRLTGAAKRYQRRFVIAMSLYGMALTASLLIWVLQRPESLLVAVLLALAPALPLLGVIAAIGFYLVEEEDEFIRVVMNQSALFALGGAFAVATVWGFFETFRLAPHVPAWAIFPLWCAMFGIAQPMVRLRYR